MLSRVAAKRTASALIGAGNFFELAVAAAISPLGVASATALASVVGVLLEAPVMLSVVRIVSASRRWYERRSVQRGDGVSGPRSEGCSDDAYCMGPEFCTRPNGGGTRSADPRLAREDVRARFCAVRNEIR